MRAVKTAAVAAAAHRRPSPSSTASSGTHHTQWWDQLIGQTSRAVHAASRMPCRSCRARAASHRPTAAVTSAGSTQPRPGAGSPSIRAISPWRDWLSTIHALPTRPVSHSRRVQKETVAEGSSTAPHATVPAKAASAVAASPIRPRSSSQARNTAGVSLIPAAIPRAAPAHRAPGGRVRSHRVRQATARLT